MSKKSQKMKKFIFNRLILICVAMSSFSSCVVYHPHNVNVPLLRERGEMQLEANVSTTIPFLLSPSLNASYAYAPINMLGLQASGSFTDGQNMFGQVAAGTFHTFGSSVLECYVGYGRGVSSGGKNNDLNQNSYSVDGSYGLVFGQVDFGWRQLADNSIDVGMAMKAGVLNPSWEKRQIADDGTETVVDELKDPHFLLEPQLVFRFGIEKVKFYVNMAYSFIDGWPTDNSYFNYERFSVGIGVNYCF